MYAQILYIGIDNEHFFEQSVKKKISEVEKCLFYGPKSQF